MELSDRQEPVTVTLSLEDWGNIIAGLSISNMPLEMKQRINYIIFNSAQNTTRTLS